MKRLAIISTHPIQYNAPWFRLLAERQHLVLKVFYTWGQLKESKKYDPGFDKEVNWDIPLLDGYDYTFVQNVAGKPGSHHFNGIVNPGLINEIKAWKPNAVLVFGWCFNSHLKCLRYFHKKLPVFFRGDSTLLDEQGIVKKYFRRFFLRWVYSFVDYAFYVGSNNKAYFSEYGLKADQLIYAPHAIDNERFSEPDDVFQKEAVALKNNSGIQQGDLVLLFVGKLEQKKNPVFLIKLLEKIKDKRLKVLFVGSGEMSDEIKLAALMDDRILMFGFRNQQQMPAIYRMSDILILPSKGPGETWGLALNEAMACGKAVVATTKTGGAADLIRNDINGLIIDLENRNSLDLLIATSLKDKRTLEEMGRQSRIAIRSFTFTHIVTAIEYAVNSIE